MNAPHITTPPVAGRGAPERIAHGSTARGGGLRPHADRWTEIAVWYLHGDAPGGKRWVVTKHGMSRIEGEEQRTDSFAAGTLDRALKVVGDDNLLGRAVCEAAREWADDNRVTIENGRGKPLAFDTDRAALAWLYGEPETHNGFPTLLARDMGAGASTVRMQLRDGRPVMVPLRTLLPFIDRAAFRRALGEKAGG